MLVLTRKLNETICIGDDIEVVVLEVKGSRVRLGFRAPSNVSIRRPEAGERLVSASHSREACFDDVLIGAFGAD
jgi:carbon storage regulator